MNLISALFSVARNITDSDLDELNKLEEKANSQVIKYHTEDKNILKRYYAKAHKGWVFQLALIFAIPFVSVWIIGKKNALLNGNSGSGVSDDDREHYEFLKAQYENDETDDF